MRGAKSFWAAKYGAALAVMSMIPSVAQADTFSGDAQISILRPLAFIQVENLDFGSIISGTTAGTVTLSPTNVRTATGGVVLKGTGFQTARFAGMGVVTQRVRIRITPNTITLTGPGPSMTVDSFTIGPGTTLLQTGNSPNYRILALNGIFTFTVGGRLNVGANQPPGSYSGTFTATLDYL
jgi:spore coat protein U-like protein